MSCGDNKRVYVRSLDEGGRRGRQAVGDKVLLERRVSTRLAIVDT